ncbi:hypothetical protein RYA05_05185 [Pseudomonas syringae pv. actinidiae]|nr:hypothetical protein [Pseudomonas syringae pv. actinidiae]
MSEKKGFFKSLAKILSSAIGASSGGAGGGSESGVDASSFLTDMQAKASEVHEGFELDQQFERAVSSVLTKSLGLAAGLKGETVGNKIAGLDKLFEQKMPEMVSQSGLDNLISDYMLKSPGVIDGKLNSVVSAFSQKDMQLGGLAALISEKMQGYLTNAVPETPAQKNGLSPSPDEISQSIDNAPKPSPNMQYNNNGPSR